ncbi:MAG: NAD(P)/FAD-dependent oxidoreductase [Gammaproteobacteria bacterium]|nr:NAD(P)/FAD-dependent oxidoreductase [Gammaproteobacteria bacterium]MDE0272925.1 NAD(P)/FAD-dependent oxidoreductase [Gammaproteobacteria bacterium]
MPRIEIPGTEAQLEAALEDVNLPTLLVTLAHLTGDDAWLAPRYAPTPIAVPEGELFPDNTGGYSADVAAEIRVAAFDALRRLGRERPELPPPPSVGQLAQLMAFSVAEPIDEAYAAMLLEETNFVDRDVQWQRQLAAAPGAAADFHVAVIGAGMSGICIGAKLKAAGLAFTILEKNDAVGGTWYENAYPDCGVDTPNHFYSYSFARNPDWSGYFSKRDELHAYFERCADQFGLSEHIRLRTEVTAMAYDEADSRWRIEVRNAAGEVETLTANAVVSAVGQLNRPAMPDIEGIESFAGPLFHSARWRSDVDLTGRRVAVIGTGCSAVQLLPKTAAAAAKVSVFQRTPHWISPNDDYYRPVEKGQTWALKHIPFYAEWHRARMVFAFSDRNWPAVVADPEWPRPEQAMNEVNDATREALTGYILDQLGERRDLAPRCTPEFPVFGKRLIIDNNWYGTLARDNVALVTDPIERIVPDGLVTAGGALHQADVIIAATGFRTNQFLWPMAVAGRSGETLDRRWGDSPRAFKGTAVPDYPNFFCLYGPNTNIVHGGSIIYQVECQVHYVMQCLALMVTQGLRSMEVHEAVNDTYNDEVQALSESLAWGHPDVSSWYKNSQGRVVNNSPFSLHEFWQRLHDLEPEHYALV